MRVEKKGKNNGKKNIIELKERGKKHQGNYRENNSKSRGSINPRYNKIETVALFYSFYLHYNTEGKKNRSVR